MKDLDVSVDAKVAQVVNDLNAGWRNVVAKAMGMDTNVFQMAQGTLGLQSDDSSGLYLMADAVPPQSTTAYFDPSGKNARSTAYNQLLHALLPSNASGLRQALGDNYAAWVAYRNADTSDLSQKELFEKWADRRLDPNQKTRALTAFMMTLSDPVNVALSNYVDPVYQATFSDSQGQAYRLPVYSCSIDLAKQAVNNGASAQINYSSTTASTSSNGTTVSGSASGFWEIFSGKAGGSFSSLNQKAVSSAFAITGNVGKYATVAVNPSRWYDGSQVSRAYSAQNDFNIWDPNSNMGDWNSFFGANGSLARRVSQLLLVSDYDLTVTSKASYSQSEMSEIKTNASFGIWPFFSGNVSSTHSTSLTHNEDGSFSVRYVLNKGLVEIWGATIQSAPN